MAFYSNRFGTKTETPAAGFGMATTAGTTIGLGGATYTGATYGAGTAIGIGGATGATYGAGTAIGTTGAPAVAMTGAAYGGGTAGAIGVAGATYGVGTSGAIGVAGPPSVEYVTAAPSIGMAGAPYAPGTVGVAAVAASRQVIEDDIEYITVPKPKVETRVDTLLREAPQIQVVERIGEVPEIAVQENPLEIPIPLMQERVIEMPKVLKKQQPLGEVQEVMKQVPDPTYVAGGADSSRASRAHAQRYHSDREQRPSLSSMEDGERSARSRRGAGPSRSREASRSNLRQSASEGLLGTEDFISSRHTTPRMSPPRQKPLHAPGNELPGMRPWSPSGVAPARPDRSLPSRHRPMSERMERILGGDRTPGSADDALRRTPSRSAGILARADDMDDMWCAVLQRFPQYPDWVLVKEKTGVYRMGGAGGKKILCRISHGGLQVRVGGGWTNAINFLERHGPTGMGVRLGDETPSRESGSYRGGEEDSMVGTSPSMERLLQPTKCWAQRIGINTTPDFREQRQLASAEEARDERRQTYTEDARIAAQPELGSDFWRVRKLVRDGADPQDSTATLPRNRRAASSQPRQRQHEQRQLFHREPINGSGASPSAWSGSNGGSSGLNGASISQHPSGNAGQTAPSTQRTEYWQSSRTNDVALYLNVLQQA